MFGREKFQYQFLYIIFLQDSFLLDTNRLMPFIHEKHYIKIDYDDF